MNKILNTQHSTLKTIIISSPDHVANEAEVIQSLIDVGFETIHLRKPDWSKDELLTLIKQLKPSNYKKLVIHQHYELIEKYNLKGIHFTEKYRNELSDIQIKGLATVLKRRGMTLSTSFHDFEALSEQGKYFDYAFLSPVFDSISKQAYQSKFTIEALKNGLAQVQPKTAVYALGGITAENVHLLEGVGFEGAATGNYRII
jgi:thiamine-phosphate pyrophosphorylase